MTIDSRLHVCISRAEIDAAVDRLSAEIARDYREKTPVFIGVLKGAFIFLADLVRQIDIPLQIDFIRVASYGSSTDSSQTIQFTKDTEIPIKNQEILLVEDIIDTGRTVAWLQEYFGKQTSGNIHICALIDKKERRHEKIKIDYTGFDIPKGFLVGYGLDFAEQFRHYQDIFHLDQ